MTSHRTFDGTERRQRLKVRKAIDDAPGDNTLWIKMARMLGPDRLSVLDNGLRGNGYSEEAMGTYATGMGQRSVVREARICASRGRTPAEKLPKEILDRKLVSGGADSDDGEMVTGLSERLKRSLKTAGIITVRDFVLKTKAQLEELGVNGRAITLAANELIQQGIRTVDNPPRKNR